VLAEDLGGPEEIVIFTDRVRMGLELVRVEVDVGWAG